jgi:dienelactone hydrolase
MALGIVPGSAQAPRLWDSLNPGPYVVGYRALSSTPTVSVWYPAAPGGYPMIYGEYLGPDSTQLGAFLSSVGVPASTTAALLASPTAARMGAPVQSGGWPVVLMAQGNGEAAADQAILCEYLSSHGYVVITTPSPMRDTPMQREDQVGEYAERQARELSHALAVARPVIPFDSNRIALVSHSFGARAALLLAMHDRRIRALVSLDGGIGTASAQAAFTSTPAFDETAALPPLLHFSESLDSFMTPDYGMLRALHSAALTIRETVAMHHVHFTSYGFLAAGFPDIATVTHATPGTARSVRGVAEETLAFLDRYLH